LGYHFVILASGEIWQVIPLHFVAEGMWIPSWIRNRRTIQIVFAGNFGNNLPTQAAQESFVNLCELLLIHPDISNLRLTNADQNERVAGHRRWGGTTCPGFSENAHRGWRSLPVTDNFPLLGGGSTTNAGNGPALRW
jgi:hypothetical protein